MRLTRWVDRLDRHFFRIIGAIYLLWAIYGIVAHDWAGVLRLVPFTAAMLCFTSYRNQTNDRAFRHGWFAGIARYDAVVEGRIDEMLRAHLLLTNWNTPLTRQQYAEQVRLMEQELALLERPSTQDLLAVFRKHHRGV